MPPKSSSLYELAPGWRQLHPTPLFILLFPSNHDDLYSVPFTMLPLNTRPVPVGVSFVWTSSSSVTSTSFHRSSFCSFLKGVFSHYQIFFFNMSLEKSKPMTIWQCVCTQFKDAKRVIQGFSWKRLSSTIFTAPWYLCLNDVGRYWLCAVENKELSFLILFSVTRFSSPYPIVMHYMLA